MKALSLRFTFFRALASFCFLCTDGLLLLYSLLLVLLLHRYYIVFPKFWDADPTTHLEAPESSNCPPPPSRLSAPGRDPPEAPGVEECHTSFFSCDRIALPSFARGTARQQTKEFAPCASCFCCLCNACSFRSTIKQPQIMVDEHPSKKARTDSSFITAEDDKPTVSGQKEPSNGNELTELANSDDAKTQDAQGDDTDMNDNDDYDWWDSVVQEIRQTSDGADLHQSKEHLESFLSGVERRQAALQRMQNVFEVVVQQGLLQEHLGSPHVFGKAAAIFDQLSDRMEADSANIQFLFQQNYQRRKIMSRKLDDCHSQWQAHYEQLVHRAAAPDDDRATALPPHNDTSGALTDDDTTASTSGVNDPDSWSELMADAAASPTRTTTTNNLLQAFLQGCDRWQAAQTRFETQMDEIHAQLQQLLEQNVAQEIVEAVHVINDPTTQEEIRNRLGENFKRRAYLEDAIEEAAQKQQGMFAKLMARVVGSSSSNPLISSLMGFARGDAASSK